MFVLTQTRKVVMCLKLNTTAVKKQSSKLAEGKQSYHVASSGCECKIDSSRVANKVGVGITGIRMSFIRITT